MYNMSLLRLYRKQSWNDWLRLVDCHHHPSKMTHYWYFSVRCGWCVSHQLKHCKWCQWIALDTNCTYLSCFLFCFINCNALQLWSFVVRFWFSYILLVTMTTDLSPTYNQPLKCLTYKSMLHSGDYHLIPGPQVVNLFKGACQSSLACSSEFCTVMQLFFLILLVLIDSVATNEIPHYFKDTFRKVRIIHKLLLKTTSLALKWQYNLPLLYFWQSYELWCPLFGNC